jgi:hypothetical protein
MFLTVIQKCLRLKHKDLHRDLITQRRPELALLKTPLSLENTPVEVCKYGTPLYYNVEE